VGRPRYWDTASQRIIFMVCIVLRERLLLPRSGWWPMCVLYESLLATGGQGRTCNRRGSSTSICKARHEAAFGPSRIVLQAASAGPAVRGGRHRPIPQGDHSVSTTAFANLLDPLGYSLSLRPIAPPFTTTPPAWDLPGL